MKLKILANRIKNGYTTFGCGLCSFEQEEKKYLYWLKNYLDIPRK